VRKAEEMRLAEEAYKAEEGMKLATPRDLTELEKARWLNAKNARI
jgi:hypothetical protein